MSKEYWKSLVTCYKEQPKEYPIEYGDWAEPYSEQLAKIYAQDEIVNIPVSDEIITQMELKLNVKLPPSYIEFLKYSNGLLLPDKFTNLLPLENIDWFYTLNQEWADIWTENAAGHEEISDEEYFVYGEDQYTYNIRDRYLNSALQISDSMEGDVLLLNPEVKFGEEWEAWWFGNSLPGAIRFKSFKELLEYLLAPLEDEDTEPMTEEEYSQILEKDKERLKNMEHQLLGNIVSDMLSKGLDDKDIAKEFEKEFALTQNMEKEMYDRINQDLEEKDKIKVENDNLDFMQKVKDMIAQKSK